jgi:anti-sigma regulatory factor (Ser/Thr protein kinase)
MEPDRVSVEHRVRAERLAPLHARRIVHRILASRVPNKVLEDARLATSEVVSDALLDPSLEPEGRIEIRVEMASDVVRIEVSNPGPGFVDGRRQRRRKVATEEAFSSALRTKVVEALADSWGVSADPIPYVWFELGVAGAARSAGRSRGRALS